MKIALHDEQVGAGEALVRWECPDCGGEGIGERWVLSKDLLLMETPYAILSSEWIKRAA